MWLVACVMSKRLADQGGQMDQWAKVGREGLTQMASSKPWGHWSWVPIEHVLGGLLNMQSATVGHLLRWRPDGWHQRWGWGCKFWSGFKLAKSSHQKVTATLTAHSSRCFTEMSYHISLRYMKGVQRRSVHLFAAFIVIRDKQHVSVPTHRPITGVVYGWEVSFWQGDTYQPTTS